MSLVYWLIAWAIPPQAARTYVSAEWKALEASLEKMLFRSTAHRHLLFMALSTSEFVAESRSALSVGEQCGAGPVSASAPEAGSAIRLVEA